MKIADLKRSVIAVAIGVFAISCGGGGNRQMSQKAGDYRAAAERGDAEAQYSLGICYLDGDGVTKDMTQVAYWFKNLGIDEKRLNSFNEIFIEARYPGEAGLLPSGMPTDTQAIEFVAYVLIASSGLFVLTTIISLFFSDMDMNADVDIELSN
jgi:hypothetical protein